MKETIEFSILDLKKGDVIDIEKDNIRGLSQTKITDILSDRIEFAAPTSQDGLRINFKNDDKIKIYFWTHQGHRYSFKTKIQDIKSINEIYSALLPKAVEKEGGRRWSRYNKKMLVSFLKRDIRDNKEEAFIGRTINISGGGFMMACSKKMNIGDIVGVGFYINDDFRTSIAEVKSVNLSKKGGSDYEIAIEFLDYTNEMKEDLDKELGEMSRR